MVQGRQIPEEWRKKRRKAKFYFLNPKAISQQNLWKNIHPSELPLEPSLREHFAAEEIRRLTMLAYYQLTNEFRTSPPFFYFGIGAGLKNIGGGYIARKEGSKNPFLALFPDALVNTRNETPRRIAYLCYPAIRHELIHLIDYKMGFFGGEGLAYLFGNPIINTCIREVIKKLFALKIIFDMYYESDRRKQKKPKIMKGKKWQFLYQATRTIFFYEKLLELAPGFVKDLPDLKYAQEVSRELKTQSEFRKQEKNRTRKIQWTFGRLFRIQVREGVSKEEAYTILTRRNANKDWNNFLLEEVEKVKAEFGNPIRQNPENIIERIRKICPVSSWLTSI